MSHFNLKAGSQCVVTCMVRIGSPIRRPWDIVIPRIFLRTGSSTSSREQCVLINFIRLLILSLSPRVHIPAVSITCYVTLSNSLNL